MRIRKGIATVMMAGALGAGMTAPIAGAQEEPGAGGVAPGDPNYPEPFLERSSNNISDALGFLPEGMADQIAQGVMIALIGPAFLSSFGSSFLGPSCTFFDTRGC